MRHYPQIGPWNAYDMEFRLLLDLYEQIAE